MKRRALRLKIRQSLQTKNRELLKACHVYSLLFDARRSWQMCSGNHLSYRSSKVNTQDRLRGGSTEYECASVQVQHEISRLAGIAMNYSFVVWSVRTSVY